MVLRVTVLRRRWRQSTERVRKPRRQTTDTSRNGEALMPQFLFSTAMTANQAGLNPLAGWQYEYLPWPAQVLLLVRSTTTGTRVTIYSGSETIRERTPLQDGGTAFVTSRAGTSSATRSPSPRQWATLQGIDYVTLQPRTSSRLWRKSVSRVPSEPM